MSNLNEILKMLRQASSGRSSGSESPGNLMKGLRELQDAASLVWKAFSEKADEDKPEADPAEPELDDDDAPVESSRKQESEQSAPPSAPQSNAKMIADVAKETGLPPEQVQAMFESGQLRDKWRDESEDAAPSSVEDDLKAITDAQGKASQGEPAPDSDPADDGRDSQGGDAEPSGSSTAIDAAQLGLDAVGVLDPTPISDGVNATISVGRMFTDRKRWKEHAGNAAISTVSMVPYVGDFAKLLKTKRAAKVVQRGAKLSRETRAARKAEHAEDAGDLIATRKAKGEQREGFRSKARKVVNSVLRRDDDRELEDDATIEGTDQSDQQALDDAGAEEREASGGGFVQRSLAFVGRMAGVNGGGRSGNGGGGDEPPGEDGEDDDAFDKWSKRLEDGAGKVGDFADKIGDLAGPVVKAAGAAVAFVKGLEMLNSGVIALNRELSGFNGGIASSYAQYDSDKIQRDIRKGQELEGPLDKLLDSQSDLKDSLDEFSVPMQAIGIEALAYLTQMTNAGLQIAGAVMPMADLLRIVADWITMNQLRDKDDPALHQFFEQVAKGAFDGKRPEFPGRKP